MIEEIRRQLQNKEFKNTGVNIDSVFLYSKVVEEDMNLVILVNFNKEMRLSYEQYFNIKDQIYRNFKERSGKKVQIQAILFANQTDNVKEIATNDWDAWIIDTTSLNLIVYENQRLDFLTIRKDIENVLELKKEKYDNAHEQGMYRHDTMEGRFHSSSNDKKNNSSMYRPSISMYLTKVNTIIIILNVIIFFLTDGLLFGSRVDKITNIGALYWPSVFYNKEYYRLLTYMFLHGGISHLANNMIILLFIGDNLERAVGKVKYLIIYFASGILAGAASIGYNMIKNTIVISVGASGAIFGVVGALAYIVIVNKGRLEDISTRQIIFFVVLSLYGGFTSQGVDNTAHVGGLIAGALLGILLYRRRKKKDLERGYE